MFNEQSVGKILFGVIIVLLENTRYYTSEHNSDGLSSVSTCLMDNISGTIHQLLIFLIIVTFIGLKFLFIVSKILPMFFYHDKFLLVCFNLDFLNIV